MLEKNSGWMFYWIPAGCLMILGT